jgi:hypothetical protein
VQNKTAFKDMKLQTFVEEIIAEMKLENPTI